VLLIFQNVAVEVLKNVKSLEQAFSNITCRKQVWASFLRAEKRDLSSVAYARDFEIKLIYL
jgi:hypothetical protein